MSCSCGSSYLMYFTERLRETGRNGLLQNVLLVLTSFRTALICWLLFYILTENMNLNSTRTARRGIFDGFHWFQLECECGRGGVMHFVCLFFSLAWMPWIIFTEALGSYWVLWDICHGFYCPCLWASWWIQKNFSLKLFCCCLLLQSKGSGRDDKDGCWNSKCKNYHTEKGHILHCNCYLY